MTQETTQHDVALRPLNGLALCAGIGGLELGLRAAFPGLRLVGVVERDPYAASVLVARMEEAALDPAPIFDDLRSFDGRPWRGVVDLVSAGYPCQPFSVAGKRLGDADERHLWPEVRRIVDECAPALVCLENVAGHVRLGLDAVLGDLASLGFDAEWGVVAAADAGAPHRRERLFVLAYRHGDGLALLRRSCLLDGERATRGDDADGRSGAPLANADVLRRHERTDEAEPAPPGRSERVAAGGLGVLADASLLTQRQEGRGARGGAEPSGPGSDVADADRSGPGGARPSRKRAADAQQQRAGVAVGALADPDGRRRDGDGLHERDEQRRVAAVARGGSHGQAPLSWPPRPDDRAGWAEVLRARPDLEPAVRRVAHGAAPGLVDRVDRLRCLGNGVVPDQATLAILELARRALA